MPLEQYFGVLCVPSVTRNATEPMSVHIHPTGSESYRSQSECSTAKVLRNSPRETSCALSSAHPLEQSARRFVVGVLRNQFAHDGELEDGLFELVDAGSVVNRVSKWSAMRCQLAANSAASALWVRVPSRVSTRLGGAAPLSVCCRFQPVAEGHQFIDFGDDAVLFGEGREGNGIEFEKFLRQSSSGPPCLSCGFRQPEASAP